VIRREALGQHVAPPVARLLARSCRIREILSDGTVVRHKRTLGNEIYILWHSTLLLLGLANRDQGGVILISRHRDGEILTRAMTRLGYGTARGSSTRGGPVGLREMIRAGQAGRPLGMTPDGPTGPPRECKPGPVYLAAETGLMIVPCAAAATRSKRFDSWDRFVLPLPGATIYCSYGEPVSLGPLDRSVDHVAGWQAELTRQIDAQLARCEAMAAQS